MDLGEENDRDEHGNCGSVSHSPGMCTLTYKKKGDPSYSITAGYQSQDASKTLSDLRDITGFIRFSSSLLIFFRYTPS